MAVRKIDKPEWRAFFDWLSQGLLGARAEIEVSSLDLGDQIEAEGLPLFGITYDHKDDVVEIALEGVDHLIYGPREVWADLNVGEMISFEVIDDRWRRQHQRVGERDDLRDRPIVEHLESYH